MSDLIDRQDAIEALGEEPPVWYDGDDEIAERNQWRRDKAAIEAVPPACNESKQQATASSDCIYRKDAIDALKEHRTLYCDNTPDTFSKLSYAEKSRVDELATAIATLINLPSAEKVQLSGEDATFDCISRQDAITAIFDLCGEVDTDNPHVDAIEEVLGNLPSASTELSNNSDTSWDWEEQYANCPLQEVKPERKKGHWVYYDEYYEAVTHTCSECGKRMTTAIGVKASFCWNCGADMREGEEE